MDRYITEAQMDAFVATVADRVNQLAQQVAALTDIVGRLCASQQPVWEQPPSLPAQVRGEDERRYMDPEP